MGSVLLGLLLGGSWGLIGWISYRMGYTDGRLDGRSQLRAEIAGRANDGEAGR